MTYIGIDNGVSGGIVAIGPCAGTAPFLKVPMPTVEMQDGGKEIDAEKLEHFMHCIYDGEVIAIVEECPMHADRASIMRSMAFSFGIIWSVLERMRFRHGWTIIRVKSGNSMEGWQRAMIGAKVPKGRTKEYALAAAQSIWPGESWVAKGCRTPHTGLIDAALIAEFGRRKHEKNNH